jgi:hypothetical protein
MGTGLDGGDMSVLQSSLWRWTIRSPF